MPSLSRRRFLSDLSAVTAATALGGPFLRFGEAREQRKGFSLPKTYLGDTGFETSVLGIGTGGNGEADWLGAKQARFVDLMLHAFRRGIRLIETAERDRSHIFLRSALQEAAKAGIRRKEFFLLSQTDAKTADAAKVVVDRYLYEMECQYIDALLLDGDPVDTAWSRNRQAIFDVLLAEKKRGRIKTVGISCRSPETLPIAAGIEEIDLLAIRLDSFGRFAERPASEMLPYLHEARKQGKAILGTGIWGNGSREMFRQRADRPRLASFGRNVDSMTFGFTEKSQIDEALEMITKAVGYRL